MAYMLFLFELLLANKSQYKNLAITNYIELEPNFLSIKLKISNKLTCNIAI